MPKLLLPQNLLTIGPLFQLNITSFVPAIATMRASECGWSRARGVREQRAEGRTPRWPRLHKYQDEVGGGAAHRQGGTERKYETFRVTSGAYYNKFGMDMQRREVEGAKRASKREGVGTDVSISPGDDVSVWADSDGRRSPPLPLRCVFFLPTNSSQIRA